VFGKQGLVSSTKRKRFRYFLWRTKTEQNGREKGFLWESRPQRGNNRGGLCSGRTLREGGGYLPLFKEPSVRGMGFEYKGKESNNAK